MSAKQVVIRKKEALTDGFLTVNRITLEHTLFSGEMSEPIVREVMERGHSVAVLLHDPAKDEIVLVEQFRIGALNGPSAWLTELVAGVVEAGENLEEVARREALEESGAQVHKLEYITQYYCSAGGSTETTAIFYAQIDASQVEGIHGVKSEHEDIRVVKIAVEAFKALLNSQQIHTASLMIAGLWFFNAKR